MAEISLSEVKRQYAIFEKKHKLPSFESLNADFEIDKISEETDCLLRVVRRVIMEKVVNSIQFLEMLVNPMGQPTPRIYLAYIKSMSQEDRQLIEDIYNKLGEISLESLALEINYSEVGEAKMIIKSHQAWNSLKPKFDKIMANLRNPKAQNSREKSYFG